MATFEELMEQFRNPGETGVPETFADELTAAYQDDLSIRDAAVKERDRLIEEAKADIVARDNENMRLKAVNYDLLVAAPKTVEPVDNEEPDTKTASGIDSLFE